MRVWLALHLLSFGAAVALGGCKSPSERRPPPPEPVLSALVALPPPRPVRPISSGVVAFEKQLQAEKLEVPARREDCPLAFGKGVFGQLTEDALRVFDAADFRLLATEPLDGPRALLALADGALLAVGERAMLRWEPGKTNPTRLPKPVLLPGTRLYADAQQPDLIWVFDDGRRIGGAASLAALVSYRLTPNTQATLQTGVLLPEQTVELTAPRGGAFGPTREGVWLYLASGNPGVALQVERLSPGGLRLPGLRVSERPLPTWVLPARRLDQSWWVEETGSVSRVLVTPTYKHLSAVKLSGKVVASASGDEGRVLAAVVVTGSGPRFELELLDQDLAPVSRVVLASEPPTGDDNWVRVVTENQAVVVAARQPRVAVGGPARVTIFDAQGQQLFSIPSK